MPNFYISFLGDFEKKNSRFVAKNCVVIFFKNKTKQKNKKQKQNKTKILNNVIKIWFLNAMRVGSWDK